MQRGSRAPSLLRPHTPLLVFLAPFLESALPVAVARPCSKHLATTSSARHKRPIRSQQALRQASSAAATAAGQQSSEDDRPQPNDGPLFKPQREPQPDVKRRQMSILERLKDPSRNTQAPTSDQERDRQIDSLLGRPSHDSDGIPNRSSALKTFDGLTSADIVERSRIESRRKEFAAAQKLTSRQKGFAHGMKMPPRVAESKQQDFLQFQEPTRAVATIKSRPSLGRTIEVMPERGLDLGRALRSLEVNCAINNVRGDAQQQRFHERPGMKRKRLHSLRWRRNFKIGFRAVIGKVKAMRRKGW
ncbi:MAG: hypothetical protein LQ337_004216 [Flavoplaca oasis]|nr:MAG: hypothetical protein LQ337_004216 [Flavoplaca oasis]